MRLYKMMLNFEELYIKNEIDIISHINKVTGVVPIIFFLFSSTLSANIPLMKIFAELQAGVIKIDLLKI